MSVANWVEGAVKLLPFQAEEEPADQGNPQRCSDDPSPAVLGKW